MTARRRPDPRIERSRRAVLEAAVELLLDGGLNAVTVDAVTARSGVAKTTIYRHWESRDALVVDTFRACLPVPTEVDPTLDFEEGLRSLMRATVALTGEPNFRAALPHVLASKAEVEGLTALQRQQDERTFAALKGVLRRGVEEGRLPADTDVVEAKHQLLGHLLSLALTPGAPLDRATADRIVELFLRSRAV